MGTTLTLSGLRHWLAVRTARERLFLLVGGGAVAAAAFISLPSADEEGAPGVELAIAAVAAPAPAEAPPPPAISPLPAPASPEGIVLRGVMGGFTEGGAAIFRLPDGRERTVRIGRDVIPGLTLKQIGVSYGILSSANGDIRMTMNSAAGASPIQPAPSTESAPRQAAGGGDRETLRYRLGLAPHKEQGRVKGFVIRPGADLPVLQKAGLRPGDMLVAVNSQPFESEEKVLELSREIAGSYTATFDFLRDGKQMTADLDVNPRPR